MCISLVPLACTQSCTHAVLGLTSPVGSYDNKLVSSRRQDRESETRILRWG